MSVRFNGKINFYPLDSDGKRRTFDLFLKAYEQQMKGDLDAAVALDRQSFETCRTVKAFTFLGWTHGLAGLYEEAVEECRKAIRTDPEFGNLTTTSAPVSSNRAGPTRPFPGCRRP